MATGPNDYREWRRLVRDDPTERRNVFQYHYYNGEFGMIPEDQAWLNFEHNLDMNPNYGGYLFSSYFTDNPTNVNDYLTAQRERQVRANRRPFRMSDGLRRSLVATAIGVGSLGMAFAIDGQDNPILNGIDELSTYVGAALTPFGLLASGVFGLRDWFRR